MVETADDDEVFEPARDVQLAVVDKAEVARAQERAFARVQQVGVKGLFGLFQFAPIALRDARPTDPHLADLLRLTPSQAFGIDDAHLLIQQRAAATDQRLALRVVVRIAGLDDEIAFEGARVERFAGGWVVLHTAGDDEGRLRQPVTGVKGLAPKAAGRERLGEPVERLAPDRLSAVEGHRPTAEVEFGALLRRDLARAEIVSKIRPAARRRLVARDGLQPQEGSLQKSH